MLYWRDLRIGGWWAPDLTSGSPQEESTVGRGQPTGCCVGLSPEELTKEGRSRLVVLLIIGLVQDDRTFKRRGGYGEEHACLTSSEQHKTREGPLGIYQVLTI